MSDFQPTRVTLLQRLCNNEKDELSWNEFSDAYKRYIYLLIRGMKIDHHDAEDLTQASLLGIWERISDFNYSPDSCKFRTWLYRNHETVKHREHYFLFKTMSLSSDVTNVQGVSPSFTQ